MISLGYNSGPRVVFSVLCADEETTLTCDKFTALMRTGKVLTAICLAIYGFMHMYIPYMTVYVFYGLYAYICTFKHLYNTIANLYMCVPEYLPQFVCIIKLKRNKNKKKKKNSGMNRERLVVVGARNHIRLKSQNVVRFYFFSFLFFFAFFFFGTCTHIYGRLLLPLLLSA